MAQTNALQLDEHIDFDKNDNLIQAKSKLSKISKSKYMLQIKFDQSEGFFF